VVVTDTPPDLYRDVEALAACIRITRTRLSTSAEEERALFGWLAAALDVPVSAELLARCERIRERRLGA
jgi:hypothetical protein